MNAGTLEIQLMANIARLQKDMDDARRVVGSSMSSISNSVAVAKGALIGLGVTGLVAAFANNLKSVIDLADGLSKLSQRTGITTETLSQLQYAASMSGVSADTLTTGLKKLNLSIGAGLAGDREKLATFKALGITLTDSTGKAKGADKVLLELADSFAKSRDGANKTTNAVALLGKAGDEMIPLLNGGSRALIEMQQEADKLGLTIGSDFAKAAEEFNDNLERVQVSSQKLTIALAGDLVEGLGKALKAMADAAIEGGKLAGVIAGIQMLLTGDDLYKANMATVKGTELVMAAEAALDRARASGDTARVARLQKALELRKQELATDNNYRKSLEADEDKSKAAAAALKAAKDKLPDMKVASVAAAETEYTKLIKRIKEQIDLDSQALALGRDLTESEKFRVKVLSDMAAAKTTVTAAERASIESKLKEKEALDLQTLVVKSQNDQAKETAAERQRIRTKDYEEAQRFAEGEREIENGRNKTMRDALQGYADEAAGLTQTNAEREVSIRLREVERQGLVKGSAAYEEYAAKLKDAIGSKSRIEDNVRSQVDMWQSIDGAAKEAFTSIGKNGNNVFDKLKDSLQSGLYALLYEMTVKKWLINISTQVSGAGVAQQALGSVGSGGGLGGILGILKGVLGLGGGSSIGNMGADFLVPGFDGGGYTGPGQRSGGLDGKGGFMALMHPQETVVDHTKGEQAGSSGMTFAPVSNITVAGGIGAGEAVQAIQQALAENNRQWTEQLKRQGVLA